MNTENKFKTTYEKIVPEKLRNLISKYYEIIVYIIVGGCTTLVNWCVSFILYYLAGLSDVPTNIIAWVVAVAFAYITNDKFVFRMKYVSPKNEVDKIVRFVSSRLATLVLEVGIPYILVNKLGYSFAIVKVVVSILIIILNYVFSKLFVFIKKDK